MENDRLVLFGRAVDGSGLNTPVLIILKSITFGFEYFRQMHCVQQKIQINPRGKKAEKC
jgi:hypothetical protein